MVLGTGGHGRESLEVIEAIATAGGAFEPIGFLDDDATQRGSTINDYPVLGTRDWLIGRQTKTTLAIGIASPAVRFAVVRWAQANGIDIPSLVHPACQISRRAVLGAGIMLMAGTRVSTNVVVADFVHINVGCSISHDCRLGPFSTIGPGAYLAGAVTVEEGAEFGTGAVARPGAAVGRWSIIGAGAAVAVDVPANSVAVGVPARVIRTREEGWHQSL